MGALSETWKLLRDTVLSFIDDEALGRGAAISFYTVTSVAPVLLIVIAIAGLAFGRDAAQNALTAQLSGLMGQQSAEILQSAVASAAGKSSGILATIVGIITLFATASGVFGEMQSALNAIWKVHPTGTTVSRLVRARCKSGVGGRTRIFSHGLTRRERGTYCVRQPNQFHSAVRTTAPKRTELCYFVVAHLHSFRGHL
jgi:hypothetical protein